MNSLREYYISSLSTAFSPHRKCHYAGSPTSIPGCLHQAYAMATADRAEDYPGSKALVATLDKVVVD